MIKAFKADPENKELSMINPKNINEKYSGGPNLKANSPKGGAKNINPIKLNVPAMKDPNAEIPKATPALPCLAI
jgi:hypothetical protein